MPPLLALPCLPLPARLTTVSLILARPRPACTLPPSCCPPAAHYEDLMNAEAQGKAGKKGQWSNKEPPKPHVNDVSLPGTATRAKQHLSFLQRAGKTPAVCEYVLSGHRIKLYVPKEGVTIAFNPSGVRCPQRGQKASEGRPAIEVRCAALAVVVVAGGGGGGGTAGGQE